MTLVEAQWQTYDFANEGTLADVYCSVTAMLNKIAHYLLLRFSDRYCVAAAYHNQYSQALKWLEGPWTPLSQLLQCNFEPEKRLYSRSHCKRSPANVSLQMYPDLPLG